MTRDPDAPAVLLAAARTTLHNPAAMPGSTWARSTALLARQALEATLARYWAARAPGMEHSSATAQLLCLPFYTDDPAAARLAHQTWASLSRACHHHPYELAPTTAELQGWLHAVGDVIAELAPEAARG